ncbi:MAG: hypothetical protein LM566_04495 [Pyrobaculum sp.]|nr:hypothetical protein [Pyrobaculum sp.]
MCHFSQLDARGGKCIIHVIARSWRQKWSKEEAIDLVASYLRRGEWTPLLTMWLGAVTSSEKKVLKGIYKLVIAAKEPCRLGLSTYEALVARGRETFVKLREAGVYGELLDLPRAHRWIEIKLATCGGFSFVDKLFKWV